MARPIRPAGLLLTALLTSLLALAAPALAHNTYPTDDDAYLITLGDQNEPMYTWKWTGLDLIVRHNNTERTPVEGVEETLQAWLIAPGGKELTTPLRTQFGTVGRYQFEEGYIYTQPGLYRVRLEGTINGTPVNGTFDMPGPREPMDLFTFPDTDVPDLLTLQAENAALREELAALTERMDAMDAHMAAMMEGQGTGGTTDGHGNGGSSDEDQAGSPAFTVLGALLAALIALVAVRVQRP